MKSNINYSLMITLFTLIVMGCTKENKQTESTQTEESLSDQVRLTARSIKEIGLQTEKAALKSFTGYMTIPAKVTVNQDYEAHVGSLVPGRVQKVLVKVGDVVKAGQTLMIIEGLEIGEIKAEYFKAKAALVYTQTNYERQKELIEEKIGSQKTLMEAQSEYEKSKAEFKAADEKIHSIGLSEDELSVSNSANEHVSGILSVKAPIGGMVVERNVVVGQMLDASGTALKIVNTRTVWIDGQIYEKDCSKFASKPSVRFMTSSYPQEQFKGRMIYIGQIVDERTRTILIRCEFDNPEYKLKPQMFGELKIQASPKNLSFDVPADAIVKINQKNFIFIQTGDSTFDRRPVVTGLSEGDRVEITDGLKEGENIVIKGSFYLKSEMLKNEFGEEE